VVDLESFSLTDSICFSQQPSTPILMYDKLGKYTVMTLEQLLPMSFGPDKLLSTEELAQNAAASN
jgi:hypothetical protein